MKAALTNKCIGFIGVGVMGSSIIKSLLAAALPANQIFIADKSEEKADQITATYKVAKQSISQIGQNCEVIFLAVKPQDLGDVLVELSKSLKSETLLISIAAGKTTRFIEEKLSTKNPVVRVMPNTPDDEIFSVTASTLLSGLTFNSNSPLDPTAVMLPSLLLIAEFIWVDFNPNFVIGANTPALLAER